MAWISVHEQVVGGKLRTLAKELNWAVTMRTVKAR